MWFGIQCEAEDALAIGLVDRLSEDGKVLDDAIEFANKIAKRPPLSIAAITKLVNISPSISPDLHLKIEREELGRLFTTKDMQEGMTAFFQKKEPVFKGE